MTAAAAGPAAGGRGPLGVLCFGGDLPLRVADAARASGEEVFVVAFRGFAAPALERYPHEWVRLGRMGHLLRALRRRAVRRIAIVGAIARPSLRDLSIDWTGLLLLPRAVRMLRGGGDDRVLRTIVGYFESKGLDVIGVSDIAPGLLAGEGLLGGDGPSAAEGDNARVGLALLDALSAFDAGQACVVLDGRPVAIEGAEGTDAMIRRVAEMRSNGRLKVQGRRGVLVKAAKRGQDLRVDLPTIGPRTIELAAEAKLAGVAVEAGRTLIADREESAALAARHGLFLVGLARP